jgi:hypothetical protein
MTATRHAPIRKDEFTKDQWFDMARAQEPGLTRAVFDARWPDFCKFIEHMQNMEIIEYKLNG